MQIYLYSAFAAARRRPVCRPRLIFRSLTVGLLWVGTLLTVGLSSPSLTAAEALSPGLLTRPVWSPSRRAPASQPIATATSKPIGSGVSRSAVQAAAYQETVPGRSSAPAPSVVRTQPVPQSTKVPSAPAAGRTTVGPGTIIYDEGNWPLAVSADDAILYPPLGGYGPMAPSCGMAMAGRLWVRGEYLLWWTEDFDVPALVTTSPVGTAIGNAGVLGRPTTEVLFGNEGTGGGLHSGARVTIGSWLGATRSQGIEVSFLGLGQRSDGFSRDSGETPILARPFFDEPSGNEAAMLVAFPNLIRGSVVVDASSEFQSAEILWRSRLMPPIECGPQLDVLLGYRYARLDESLRVEQFSQWTAAQGQIIPGTTKTLFDLFDAENRFHGAQVGVVYEQNVGIWSVELLMKLALGYTESRVFIDGATRTTVPAGGSAVFRGGLLAQPTNMGRHEDSSFAVIPELGVTLARYLTPNLRATAGYTFLYWSQVARPGDQIDLDMSQLPPEPPRGSRSPEFRFTHNDFWAQGLRFGLEYRF